MKEAKHSKFSIWLQKTLFVSLLAIGSQDVLFAQEYKPEVIRLPNTINSNGEELMPVPLPDGKTLYFLKGLNPNNIGGPRAGQDAWVATKNDSGKWEPAVNLGRPINNVQNNSICGISDDGQRLYVMNEYLRKNRMRPGVSVSHKEDGAWTEPEDLDIKGLDIRRGYLGAHMQGTEDILLLSYVGPDSKGREDLYVSFKDDKGKWTDPINLGNQINTRGFEISPFLAEDKKTLFFASSAHNSYGSADIFVTTRKDDSWTNWTPPKNLGPLINSESFDAYFYLLPDSSAYFSIADPFGDEGDIYYIPKFDTATFINYDESDYEEEEEEPIAQVVEPEEEGTGEDTEDSREGEEEGTKEGDDQGDDDERDEDDADHREKEDVRVQQQVIETHPMFDGRRRSINEDFPDINFDFASYQLNAESKERLDKMVHYLRKNQDYSVELLGHTDTIDNDLVNIILGGRRAWMAKQYVVSKGINPKRIVIMSLGRHRPKVANTDPEARAINRRVEIYVVEE